MGYQQQASGYQYGSALNPRGRSSVSLPLQGGARGSNFYSMAAYPPDSPVGAGQAAMPASGPYDVGGYGAYPMRNLYPRDLMPGGAGGWDDSAMLGMEGGMYGMGAQVRRVGWVGRGSRGYGMGMWGWRGVHQWGNYP